MICTEDNEANAVQAGRVLASTRLNNASPVRKIFTLPGDSVELLSFDTTIIAAIHLIRSAGMGSQKRKVENVIAVQAPNPSDFISSTTHPEINAAKKSEPTHIPKKKNPAL